jgi:serine/threonine protein kinase
MPDSSHETSPSSPTPAPLRHGDKVEQYTITSQIGSGGSSVVFKATDHVLDKQVAIKQFLLSGEDDEPRLRKKIYTEAKLHQKAAAADPARLVQVVDVVDGPHGLLLISEFIDGPSLEQILAQNTGPMDTKQALGIIAAAALALEAIHSQGIVHLDLKPANILMPRTGGLKISDFGLATDLKDNTPPTAGTVRYMAPELLQHGKVDSQADLYSLGMMAYEMLAGRTKFDQAFKLVLRDQRNQAIRWVKWHTNKRAQAPTLNGLIPDITPALAELVARMMHKDPTQRIGSAKDLVHAIKRHFAGKDAAPTQPNTGTRESLPPQSTSPGDTHELPTKNHSRLVVIIAVVMCVLIASAAGLFFLDKSRSAQQEAVAQARTTMDLAKEAYRDGRYQEALTKFDRVSQNKLVKATLGRHARAGALLAQGRLAVEEEQYDEAIEAFTQAAGLGQDYNDKARPLIDDTRQAQAFTLTTTKIDNLITHKQFGEARKELQTWRDLAATDQEQQTLRALGAKLEDQQSRWRVQELVKQATKLTSQGKRSEAIELLRSGPQRLEVADLLKHLEAESESDQAVTLALAAIDLGNTEEAIRQYELAIQARPNDALKNRLTDLRSDWLLEEGLRMLAQGNTIGADQLLTEALGYRPDNQQARDALKQIASSSRQLAFIEAGDAAAARQDFDTAFKQYENALALGVDGPLADKMTDVRIQILLAQSRTAISAGRIDEANEYVSQARQLDTNNPDVAAVLHEVKVRGEYVRHLKAGDEARDRSAFGDAKRHYLRAKKEMDTPQVRARLDEAEYDHIVAQARNFIAAGEYPSANAQLQIAAGIRMTDEIRQLREQILAEAPPGSEPSP